MGSHQWTEQCPYCGFENMLVSWYDSLYSNIACPVCGYARWTEEKIPPAEDIELAKRTIREMSMEEMERVTELFYEENTPLITRLKDKPPEQG